MLKKGLWKSYTSGGGLYLYKKVSFFLFLVDTENAYCFTINPILYSEGNLYILTCIFLWEF
jgi:hypothetical protein